VHYSKKTLAILSLSFVALGYSLASVAVRFLAEGFQPFTQVYLRIGLGFLLSLLIFGKHISIQKLTKVSKKDWVLLIIMGTAGYGLAVDLVTLGVLHTKLLNVAVLTSTAPLFVFLYSLIFLRKHVNKLIFLFILLGVYGVGIIATKSFLPTISDFGIGEFYSLLFAAGVGCYSISRRFLSKNITNSEITVIVMFFAFISSFLVAMIAQEPLTLDGFSQPIVLLGLAIGLIFNLTNTHLENFGFQYIRPVIGSQLLLLENVFSPILGFLLFSEVVSGIEFIGAAIVIGSVVIANKFAPSEKN
jgi:drug/metabolite transporter (DMT)-like permease